MNDAVIHSLEEEIRYLRSLLGLQRYKTLRIGCSVQESASIGTECTEIANCYIC